MMGYNTLMEGRSELITSAVEDPDLILLRAIARGDAHALEELYASQGPGILAYLVSRLGDRQLAEEVLQDVMLAVWQGANRFRGESRVRTWMLSIARYKAINAQRGAVPTHQPIDEDLPDLTPDPSLMAEHGEAHTSLREALQRLPEAQREILELVFYHQLTGNEAARVMGVSTGTVKSRLHRAKANLRKLLDSEGKPHGDSHD